MILQISLHDNIRISATTYTSRIPRNVQCTQYFTRRPRVVSEYSGGGGVNALNVRNELPLKTCGSLTAGGTLKINCVIT